MVTREDLEYRVSEILQTGAICLDPPNDNYLELVSCLLKLRKTLSVRVVRYNLNTGDKTERTLVIP